VALRRGAHGDADRRGVRLASHYRASFADVPEFDNLGPITDLRYPSSDVTVFRLTRESNVFYYFTGKTLESDKKSFSGSRGWVKDLKLYGQPIKAMDLLNTLLNNGAQHHYPFILKDVGGCIEEFAYWLGLEKIRRLEYKDYLYV